VQSPSEIPAKASRCPKCEADLLDHPTPPADPLTGTRKCPECAEEIRAEARKCRYCGHRFDRPAEGTRYCNHYGAPTPATLTYCGQCGGRLIHPTDAPDTP
jgi:hypothetical protein